MAWRLRITASNQAAEECTAKDRHKVTNIEGHDSQHPGPLLAILRGRESLYDTYSRYPTPAITTSTQALGKSCVILQGRTPETFFFMIFMLPSSLVLLETLTFDSSSFSLSSTPAMIYWRLDSTDCHFRSCTARSANSVLKTVARRMRKMHVPAYCPVFEGDQEAE